MDEVQVDISAIQIPQTSRDTLFNTMMPCVIQLGSHPNIFSRHAAVFDALSDLGFVAVSQSSVNVSVATLQSDFDGMANFVRLGLPGPQPNGRNASAGVELEGLPSRVVSERRRHGTNNDMGKALTW